MRENAIKQYQIRYCVNLITSALDKDIHAIYRSKISP